MMVAFQIKSKFVQEQPDEMCICPQCLGEIWRNSWRFVLMCAGRDVPTSVVVCDSCHEEGINAV